MAPYDGDLFLLLLKHDRHEVSLSMTAELWRARPGCICYGRFS